jgi:hypothetical protein
VLNVIETLPPTVLLNVGVLDCDVEAIDVEKGMIVLTVRSIGVEELERSLEVDSENLPRRAILAEVLTSPQVVWSVLKISQSKVLDVLAMFIAATGAILFNKSTPLTAVVVAIEVLAEIVFSRVTVVVLEMQEAAAVKFMVVVKSTTAEALAKFKVTEKFFLTNTSTAAVLEALATVVVNW